MAELLGKNRVFAICENKKTVNDDVWQGTDYDGTGSNAILKTNYDADVSVVNPDVDISEQNNVSEGGLVAEYARIKVDATSGMPTMNFECYPGASSLLEHLKYALQYSEAGTYPSLTLKSQQAVSMPTYKGNSATTDFLATVISDSGTNAEIIKNSVVDSLALSIDFNARGIAKQMKMTGTWKGIEHDTILSNTIGAKTDFSNLNQFNVSEKAVFDLTIGSTLYSDICIRNWGLNLNQNITSDCKAEGGKANNMKSAPEYTCTMDIPYTINGTDTIKEKFKAGELVYLKVYLPVGVSVVTFDIYGIITENPENYINKYVGIPLSFRIVKYLTNNPIAVKAYGNGGYLELSNISDLEVGVGTTVTITYKHYGVDNIKIEYSENDGSTWSVVDATETASGTYIWDTSALTPNTDSKLKISSVTTATTLSISNTFQVVSV